MRIELINLPFSAAYHRRLDPPLFLLQIAPWLEAQGFKLRVNDLNGVDRSQWCFGHCVMYVMYIDVKGYSNAKRIAQLCKQASKNALIVACGSGPSKDIPTYVNDPLFNVIIRGEGENAIKELVCAAFQDRGTIDSVYKGEVRNLNVLPLPSRHLVDINSYHRRLGNEKAIMVMGSRGSPYRHTWLCNGLKTFNIQRIMNEVMGIVSMYGIKNFFFGDEAFCFDKHRALNIGKAFGDKGLKFGFNDVITNVEIDLLNELAKTGCKEITLNPYGSKSQQFTDSMRSKIEEETGIRVILRHEGKYTPPPKESTDMVRQ